MINVDIVNGEFCLICLENEKYIDSSNNYILHKKYDNRINKLLDLYDVKDNNILNLSNKNLFDLINKITKIIILDFTKNIIYSKFLNIDNCYKVIFFSHNKFTGLEIMDVTNLFIYSNMYIEGLRNDISTFFKDINKEDSLSFIINKLIINIYVTLMRDIYYRLIISTPKYYLSYKGIQYEDALDIFNYLDIDNVSNTFQELKYFNSSFNSYDIHCIEVLHILEEVNFYY